MGGNWTSRLPIFLIAAFFVLITIGKGKALAEDMLSKGIYVIAFSYPVVPKQEARIRVQISANHSKNQLDQAIEAFKFYGEKYKII